MKIRNNFDLYDFIEQMKKRKISQRKIIYELLTKIDEMEMDLDEILGRLDCKDEQLSIDQLSNTKRIIENNERSIRSRLSLLYDSISAPFSVGERNLYDANKYEAENFWSKTDIKCEVKNNKIYIKIPMLLQRIIPQSSKDQMNRYPVYYDYFFSDVVRNILEDKTNSDTEMIKWTHKTITYLFVYDKTDKQYIDNSSHDTKAITDAIASQFLTGDSALTTTEVFCSTVSAEVQKGTYIIISEGQGQSFSVNDEIQNLAKLFSDSGT